MLLYDHNEVKIAFNTSNIMHTYKYYIYKHSYFILLLFAIPIHCTFTKYNFISLSNHNIDI